MILSRLFRRALPAALLFTAALAHAEDWAARPDWGKYFEAQHARGTFVLYDAQAARYSVYNPERANKGYLPASTFKIPNALLALDAGVVKDENEVFRWDHKPQPRKEWEQDLTFAAALKVSAVPVFQAVARRLGPQRMQAGVTRLNYGNHDTSGAVDRFWLSGALRITALQQVEFLRRLEAGQLPVSKRSMAIVRKMMIVETSPPGAALPYVIHAKTGTLGADAPEPVMWWVGWIERPAPKGVQRWFFAMNMDLLPGGNFEDRFNVARPILREAGALPEK